jgi:hypothetical protein
MRVFKNPLHRQGELNGKAIGEIERRIVLFGFQRIDGLPGNPDAFAKVVLGPVPLGAQHFKPVFHQRVVWMKAETHPKAAQNSG